MGVDYVRKRVTIAFRNCFRAASRHPLLVFNACVLFWTHRWFPALFSLLVYASPVIASTLALLGTLLFYGHANAPQIQKESSHHHEIHNLVFGGMGNAEIDEETYLVHNVNINDGHKFGSSIDSRVSRKQEEKSELGSRRPVLVTRGAQFQPFGTGNVKLKSNDVSRRSSFDPPHSVVLGHLDDDNKGWETGSSASASVTDTFPMLGEIHPMLQSGKIITDDDADDDHYDHEDIEVKVDDDDDDDDDDEEETVVTWTEDPRNLMNLGTLELERNQRMESLVARQKVIKNMRIMAEKNMVNIIDTHISTARNTPFDLPNHSHESILGSAPSNIIPRRNSIDLPYNPHGGKPALQTNHALGYRHRRSDVGIVSHSAVDPYPIPKRIGSNTESIGSTHTFDINKYIIPRRQAAKGDNRSNEVKKSGENKGYEDKTSNKSSSSSSSFCDVTDDIHDGDDDNDEEEEFGSIEDSPTPKSKDLQDLEDSGGTDTDTDTDSDTDSDDTEEAGFSQRLKSWFGW